LHKTAAETEVGYLCPDKSFSTFDMQLSSQFALYPPVLPALPGGWYGVHVYSHWRQGRGIPNALVWFYTLDSNLTRSLGAGVDHPDHTEPGSTGLVGN